MASVPLSRRFQNASGSFDRPGKRQPMPTMAIGSRAPDSVAGRTGPLKRLFDMTPPAPSESLNWYSRPATFRSFRPADRGVLVQPEMEEPGGLDIRSWTFGPKVAICYF